MRLMADRVGPTGRVVGLDLDGRLGREAAAILATQGYPQCTFIEGDLQSVEFLGRELFDFVFARIVLHHLDDPTSGLRNMHRFVKAGGRSRRWRGDSQLQVQGRAARPGASRS
jgi:ubiquinone/menaquinone biosynthesis C-methylase UbiE